MMIQPPTDNLYKFMAIIGLLMWVGGAIYPWTKLYEAEKEMVVLQAQIEYSKTHPNQFTALELTIKNEQIRLKVKAGIAFTIIGGLSFFVGGYLMNFGFRFWYFRVQKPLDKQLSEK